MRISRLTLAGVLVAAVLDPGAAVAQAEGLLCGLAAVTDPTGEGDVRTGEVHGGPLTATSTDPNAPSADPTAAMTLKCTVQVGPSGATHAGADAASASANGTGVVVLAPTQVSYASPDGLDTYLCTEVTINGTTYYYDHANGVWSTSVGAACDLVISQDLPIDQVCLDYLWDRIIDFTFCVLGL